MLDFSCEAAAPQLAELAVAIGAAAPSDPVATQARHFVDRVRALAREIGIPEKLDALQAADIPEIARRAMAEAQGFYPVPRFMVQSECEELLGKLLP